VTGLDPALAERARRLGVATRYEDWAGRPVDVAPEAVEAVCDLLGDPGEGRGPLVVRQCDLPALVAEERGDVVTEDGAQRPLTSDLPLGYHRLGDRELIVVPDRCPALPDRPAWGWQAQLYQLRSRRSWGLGDLADLRTLATWTGRDLGGDFVLVNPLHAVAPNLPQEASPYTAGSRRFVNPLYLCLDDLPERRRLDPAAERSVARAEEKARALPLDRIDRDAAFAAKRTAWEALFSVADRSDPDLRRYCGQEGAGLDRFATWCAIAERHGPRWDRWPRDLRDPTSAAVTAFARDHVERVDLHAWLQWQCDRQLAGVQSAARSSGMAVGIVHDLAVGVDPNGPDTWAQQDVFALGASVGAPPDSFSQNGQDWALPPWRPDRLRAAGYRPFAEMLRSLLRHAGGIRIDHALGLWRLWWVPEGASPRDGTYVSYPAEDLLGVLALEAVRAGAVVVAEDLGTVPPGVPETLRERGVASSAVVWFEHDEAGRFSDPADYPSRSLASVTTHDLPTARGFWRGEATRVRAELGLFPSAEAEQETRAGDERDRGELLAALRQARLVGADPTEDELVVALQAFVAGSGAGLVGIALSDAVGDVAQPNLPGTTDEYPSWRLPLADADGRPMTLTDLMRAPLLTEVVAAVRQARQAVGGATVKQ
jgi:4-alpha-glucanotransferase